MPELGGVSGTKSVVGAQIPLYTLNREIQQYDFISFRGPGYPKTQFQILKKLCTLEYISLIRIQRDSVIACQSWEEYLAQNLL